MRNCVLKQFRNIATTGKGAPSLPAVTIAAVFLLTLLAGPQVRAADVITVLHSFSGQGGDGADPVAGVSLRGGIVYGTTIGGGNGGVEGNGTVYQITHVGSNWNYTSIFLFPVDWTGGIHPNSTITFGPDGHPYGTTEDKSYYNRGNVFSLTPPLSICKTAYCPWKETVVDDFSQGFATGGDLVYDQQGNIYGTKGADGPGTFGSVYELTKVGNTWTEIPLWTFSGGADGAFPMDGVIIDSNGNLFGTTNKGGLYNYGTVFKLAYVNGEWVETVIYDFQDDMNGAYPVVGLTMDSSGNLYGATSTHQGGENQAGTIFELSPSGNSYTLQTLYTPEGPFASGSVSAMTIDSQGRLYGTSDWAGVGNGGIFRLYQSGFIWNFQSMYGFLESDGECPCSKVLLAPDNNFYGTTRLGGANGYGVVYMAPNYN